MNFESDRDSDMRVVLPPIMTDSAAGGAGIMTDSRSPAEEPVPTLNWVEPPAWLQTDAEQMTESQFVASLYEGVPHQTGVERERAYRREKAQAQQIEAAKRWRRPHV
jgi:hypothetical protein